MARSRMIKPEFWDDEVLAQSTSRDARLAFIGMWNHSDDYGVVKGNAVWLKSKIFPYEDIKPDTFQKWLNELEKGRWIIPFTVDGAKYYYIQAFTKHQTINRPSQQRNPSPPDSLIEDSLSTHDILTSEKKLKEVNINTLVGDGITDECPHQDIIKIFHAELPMLTRIRDWTPARQELLRARWRSKKEYQEVDWWKEFFIYIREKCPFLIGKVEQQNGKRTWQADLPWILEQKHFTKIVEGGYEG